MCNQVNCGCDQPSHGLLDSSRHKSHCGCGQNLPHRRFSTKQEIREELREYLQQLKAEAKGVEEKLADLQTES